MRVLLVDDEPLALDKLAMFFRDIPGTEVVGTAADGVAAAEAIRALSPDLVILDIQMPGRTGLGVAADLPAEGRPEIVFVTAFEQFAPDAFDVEAADYLLKPVRLDRLRRAVARAEKRRRMGLSAEAPAEGAGDGACAAAYLQSIGAPTATGLVRVPVSAIDWIEAAKDYAILHTASKCYIVRETMGRLEAVLDPAVMVRVHRSSFVRRDAVVRVRRTPGAGTVVELQDGTDVPVGPSYVRPTLDRLKTTEGPA